MKKRFLLAVVILALSSSAGFAAVTDKAKTNVEAGKAGADAKAPKKEVKLQLTKEKTEILKKAAEGQSTKIKAIYEKLKTVRKELRSIVEGEPFNKDAYLKKSEELSKLESEQFMVRAQTMAEIMPKFTPQERKVVYQVLSHNIRAKKSPKAQ